jgi:hypothetical protein
MPPPESPSSNPQPDAAGALSVHGRRVLAIMRNENKRPSLGGLAIGASQWANFLITKGQLSSADRAFTATLIAENPSANQKRKRRGEVCGE